MRSSRWSRMPLAWGCIAAAGAMLMLTGCTPGTPNAGTSSSSSAQGASAAERDSARDAYDVKLAQCLRSKGLDVKDPQPGQGIQENSPEIRAGASECMGEIGDPPTANLTAEDKKIIDATYLKTAKCFRERGYDAPDPAPNQAFAIPEGASDTDIAACVTVSS